MAPKQPLQMRAIAEMEARAAKGPTANKAAVVPPPTPPKRAVRTPAVNAQRVKAPKKAAPKKAAAKRVPKKAKRRGR